MNEVEIYFYNPSINRAPEPISLFCVLFQGILDPLGVVIVVPGSVVEFEEHKEGHVMWTRCLDGLKNHNGFERNFIHNSCVHRCNENSYWAEFYLDFKRV